MADKRVKPIVSLISSMAWILDYEAYAQTHLPKSIWDYYSNGVGAQLTLKDNRAAWQRWRLRPRMLRDVETRHLKTTVLGHHIDFPIGICPTAMHKMAHPIGEVGTAQAAHAFNIVMTLSSLATTSIEEVVRKVPYGLKWFQLYVCKDRAVTESMVKRAEEAGFKALVLTVDAQYFGTRINDIKNKFAPPAHLSLANFTDLAEGSDDHTELLKYVSKYFDPSITWDTIAWLKTITSLPIVVKGILTAEDADLAIKHGADAIQVSNHGARQLDGVFATADALPEIIEVVKGRCEVYVDGGVITGTGILKALALGARAVFIGRPILWGLTYQGEEGAKQVLQLLINEFDLAMALSGCTHISDINPSLVARAPFTSHM